MRRELITIVLPAHNEEANVAAIHAEIRNVLRSSPHAVEVIFVDDGSNDATASRVRELASGDRVEILEAVGGG